VIEKLRNPNLKKSQPRFFLSCKTMPGLNPQRRCTAHTLPNFCVVLCIFLCSIYFCVVLCIICFVSFSVLFVCICVLNYCHRVATQLRLNISYHNQIRLHFWKKTCWWMHDFKATAEMASGHVICSLPVSSFCTVTPTYSSTNSTLSHSFRASYRYQT